MSAQTHLPMQAEVVERIDESRDIFTLRLRLSDAAQHAAYRFEAGQFNMLYLFGVGEAAISIVSDPEHGGTLDHTVRAVGRVTRGLARLGPGARIGIRGPYGRGWPLREARGRDVLLVTGGLGCAPVVSVISYVMRRRAEFGHLTIVQGVKHAADLIWRERYAAWAALPDTRVLLAADMAAPGWHGHVGLVTELLADVPLGTAPPDAASGLAPPSAPPIAMMCGPEVMMRAAADTLAARGMAEDDLYLSMERNMHCALRHCGHCQFGAEFVCRDGPVFAYPRIKALLRVRGF